MKEREVEFNNFIDDDDDEDLLTYLLLLGGGPIFQTLTDIKKIGSVVSRLLCPLDD